MRITIFSVGKTKQSQFAELEEEYTRRLQGAHSIRVQYCASDTKLVEAIEQFSGYTIALDEHGKQMTSLELSDWLQQQGSLELGFIIGDAAGLPRECITAANLVLAVSQFTLPHEFVRVLLLEQLYRAHTIAIGHPYHK